MYSQTPIFTGYFASLGVKAENIVYLRFHQRGTVQRRRQARRHRPVLPLEARHSARAQPAVQGACQEAARHHLLPDDRLPDQRPEGDPGHALLPHRGRNARAAVKAAFIKEGDLFKEKGVVFLDTFVNLSKPDVFERQMYEEFKDILGPLARREHARHRRRASARSISSTTSPCAARRAKCSKQLERERSARRGAAGPSVSQRSRREPRNPGGVPEARLPGFHARTACRSTTTSSGGCSATK